jgi:hypothetical protein
VHLIRTQGKTAITDGVPVHVGFSNAKSSQDYLVINQCLSDDRGNGKQT